MGRIIAAINMTLDGFCDHTSLIADEEIHQHYNELLRSSGSILYGRITYQLMEYWRTVVENPTGNKSMDDFAIAMDDIPKIVFSQTLKEIEWKSARLAKEDLFTEVSALRQMGGKDVLVGSRSLIVTLLNLGMIDEFQLSIQPIIVGKGLPLLESIQDRIDLKLLKTKTFQCGAVLHYLLPAKK